MSEMTDQETVDVTVKGYEMLVYNANMITLLPLEDWLAAINRAETLGPVLDPTLYREYLYAKDHGVNKGEAIKRLIEAALPLKREVLKLQKEFKPS